MDKNKPEYFLNGAVIASVLALEAEAQGEFEIAKVYRRMESDVRNMYERLDRLYEMVEERRIEKEKKSPKTRV